MPPPPVALSALVITRNQADHLNDCLQSLTFADEIVVFLDRCTDDSKKVAARFTDRIIEKGGRNEGERRDIGRRQCRGDWIIWIDSDERVTPALAREIQSVVKQSKADWHKIPVNNYIGDQLVRYGWGAFISTTVRTSLYRRDAARWGTQSIHPPLSVNPKRQGKTLTHPIHHYGFKDINDLWSRLEYYTDKNALDMLLKHTQGTPLKPQSFFRTLLYTRRILSRGFKCYVSRRGYREGAYGLLIALMAGVYPILSWIKACALLRDRQSIAHQSPTNQMRERSQAPAPRAADHR